MRFDRSSAPREFESSPSALIDVIFQLVLFFVFSLSFLGEERQLHASLPKDSGFSGPSFGTRELVLALAWRDGETSCSTATYYPPEGGSPIEGYTFPQDPGLRVFADPSGAQQKATATTMRDHSGRSWKVEYDHGVPDMARVEAYLASVKRRLETLGGGLPSVTIQFDPRVPWQDVASVLDACLRVGIDRSRRGGAVAKCDEEDEIARESELPRRREGRPREHGPNPARGYSFDSFAEAGGSAGRTVVGFFGCSTEQLELIQVRNPNLGRIQTWSANQTAMKPKSQRSSMDRALGLGFVFISRTSRRSAKLP